MNTIENMAKLHFHTRHLRGEPPAHCCGCGRKFDWDDYYSYTKGRHNGMIGNCHPTNAKNIWMDGYNTGTKSIQFSRYVKIWRNAKTWLNKKFDK